MSKLLIERLEDAVELQVRLRAMQTDYKPLTIAHSLLGNFIAQCELAIRDLEKRQKREAAK